MDTKANRGRTLDMLFAGGSPGSAAAWFRNEECVEAAQRAAAKERASNGEQGSRQPNQDFNFLP